MLSKNLENSLHRTLAYANDRRHEYATLEHLLLALTEDQDAVAVLQACDVDLERLRRDLQTYVDDELGNLVSTHKDDAKPTASFQRVLQRAAIHVQSSGREEVNGANVLVAMFAERGSHAVYFLQEQDLTRAVCVNYINLRITKTPKPAEARRIGEPADEAGTVAAQLVARNIAALGQSDQNVGAGGKRRRPTVDACKVFLSYSHRDLRWISRLEVHLKPIVDLGLISHWHDRLIIPGSKWRQEIEMAIRNAKIALLLVSADFLASDFITQNEIPPLLKAAEEKGTHILPIIVGPCRFKRTPSLAEFQAVNLATRPLSIMNAHDRESLFLRVADTIETILRQDEN